MTAFERIKRAEVGRADFDEADVAEFETWLSDLNSADGDFDEADVAEFDAWIDSLPSFEECERRDCGERN